MSAVDLVRLKGLMAAFQSLALKQGARALDSDESELYVSVGMRDMPFLIAEAEAYRKLRDACEQEHGGKYYEPECPICDALATKAVTP